MAGKGEALNRVKTACGENGRTPKTNQDASVNSMRLLGKALIYFEHSSHRRQEAYEPSNESHRFKFVLSFCSQSE